MTDHDLEQAVQEALLHTSAAASAYDDGKTFTTELWRECSVEESE